MSANQTIRQALSEASDLDLLDAQLLLGVVMGLTRAALYAHDDRVLTDAEHRAWTDALDARRQGMPIAYLIGEKECYGMMFHVTPDVLIPRPDTEIVIEAVLNRFPPFSKGRCPEGAEGFLCHVLDLATGSGVIACALAAQHPDWHILATDVSEAALAVAQHNIARHGLGNIATRLSDVYQHIPEQFDVIVSNPPYIAPDDLHLDGEIRFEPYHALVAEEAGYFLLRRIIEGASDHLKAQGYLFLEHGFEQGAGVRALLAQSGFEAIETVKDLSGNERVTYARKGKHGRDGTV